jgi:hypothetical protein
MRMLVLMYVSEVSVGRYSSFCKVAPLSYRRYIPSWGRMYYLRSLIHTAVHQIQLPIPPDLEGFLEGKAAGACSKLSPSSIAKIQNSWGSSFTPSLMATLLFPISVLSFRIVYRIQFVAVAFELRHFSMLVCFYVWKRQLFCGRVENSCFRSSGTCLRVTA